MTTRYIDQARFERLDQRRAELKAAGRAMEEELIRFSRSTPPAHMSQTEIEAEKLRLRELRGRYNAERRLCDLEIAELPTVEVEDNDEEEGS